MKKILSVVLALAMTFALCTTVFAADPVVKVTTTPATDEASAVENTNKWSIPVTSGYENNATKADDQYYVVVEWEVTTTLKYTIGNDDYVWTVQKNATSADSTALDKPTNAGYVVGGKWDNAGEASVKVTLTNWSNCAINAKLDWVASTNTVDGVETNIVTTTTFDSDAAPATTKTLNATAAYTGELPGGTDLNLTTTGVAVSSTLNIKVTDGAISKANATIGTLTVTVMKAA